MLSSHCYTSLYFIAAMTLGSLYAQSSKNVGQVGERETVQSRFLPHCTAALYAEDVHITLFSISVCLVISFNNLSPQQLFHRGIYMLKTVIQCRLVLFWISIFEG